jgi:hypothetical protein
MGMLLCERSQYFGSNLALQRHPGYGDFWGVQMTQRLCARSAGPILVLVLAVPSLAHAQAWVGEKSSLEASLNYNYGFSDKVIGKDVEFPDTGTKSHQFTVNAGYVPIEKLGVDVALPFLAVKYTGDPVGAEHPGGGTYDDGSLHGTLTDLRFGARYQILGEPVAISPHLAFSIPLMSYETVGNAVAGRHLKEAHIGVSIGKIFMEAAYVHLMYEFSLAEKYDRTPDTEKFSQNHSDGSISAGYGLMDGKLDLNVGFDFRIHHDGLNWDDFADWTPGEFLHHDPILKEQIFLVGAGVGYQVTDTVSASLAARFFVAGSNTQNGSVIAVGVAWSPET